MPVWESNQGPTTFRSLIRRFINCAVAVKFKGMAVCDRPKIFLQHLASQRHKNMLEGKPPKPRWSPYDRQQAVLPSAPGLVSG